MYDLPHFKASGQQEVFDFMKAHPFVFLCGSDAAGKPAATQVPVLMEERNGILYLLGHVMRKQTHTEAFMQNPQVLAVFSGAHTYVSASWYTNKQSGSTWNYQNVQAAGILTFLGEEELHDLLTRLTLHFEGPASPSLVKDMSEAYMSSMKKAIVAFEIEVKTIGHVFKMSQNRDRESYQNIVKKLSEGDAEARQVAAIMEGNEDKLKGNNKLP